VDRAANGRDGLFLAAGESYDVIIADRLLPDLTTWLPSRPSTAPTSRRLCCFLTWWMATIE
jgi:hypothetical protein